MIFSVVKVTGKSELFDTNRILIRDTENNEFEVYCNTALEKMIVEHGDATIFRVTGKRQKLDTDNKPINSKGKIDHKNPSWIVDVFDVTKTDFSDLTL